MSYLALLFGYNFSAVLENVLIGLSFIFVIYSAYYKYSKNKIYSLFIAYMFYILLTTIFGQRFKTLSYWLVNGTALIISVSYITYAITKLKIKYNKASVLMLQIYSILCILGAALNVMIAQGLNGMYQSRILANAVIKVTFAILSLILLIKKPVNSDTSNVSSLYREVK